MRKISERKERMKYHKERTDVEGKNEYEKENKCWKVGKLEGKKKRSRR